MYFCATYLFAYSNPARFVRVCGVAATKQHLSQQLMQVIIDAPFTDLHISRFSVCSMRQMRQ